jgi:Peptidase_C39 like family
MLAWVLLAGLFLSAGTSEPHVLDVPYRNQLDGSSYALANCGPAALAMTLAYYGIDASPWDLRVRAMIAQGSWVTDEGGYSDEYGVFVYNLAAVAEQLGVHADGLWARDAARLDHFHQWQPSELRREVLADHPVIVEVEYRALPRRRASRSLDDHYIVVHGVDASGFVYSDPLGFDDRGSDEDISEGDLLEAMAQASAPRAGFAVVKGMLIDK